MSFHSNIILKNEKLETTLIATECEPIRTVTHLGDEIQYLKNTLLTEIINDSQYDS